MTQTTKRQWAPSKLRPIRAQELWERYGHAASEDDREKLAELLKRLPPPSKNPKEKLAVFGALATTEDV